MARKSLRLAKIASMSESGHNTVGGDNGIDATAPNLDLEAHYNGICFDEELEFVLLDESEQPVQLTERPDPEVENLSTIHGFDGEMTKAYLKDWKTNQDAERDKEGGKIKSEMVEGPIVAHRSRISAPDSIQESMTVSGAQSHSSISHSKPTSSENAHAAAHLEDESAGTYVQCCNANCGKWRHLPHVNDPSAVPNHWVCSMNEDGRQNSCRAPDLLGQDVDRHLVECSFTLGSVVWARLPAYPWWPAIVDLDPDSGQHYWVDGSSKVASWYHVLFFDRLNKSIGRAWVRAKDVCRFDQIVAGTSRATRKYWHPELESNFLVAKKYAEEAAQMELPKRRRVYCAAKDGRRRAKLPWSLDLTERRGESEER